MSRRTLLLALTACLAASGPRDGAAAVVGEVRVGGAPAGRLSPVVLATGIQVHLDHLAPFLAMPTNDRASLSHAPLAAALSERIVSPTVQPAEAVAGLTLMRALADPRDLAVLTTYLRSDPVVGRQTAAELSYLATAFSPAQKSELLRSVGETRARLGGSFDASSLEALFDGGTGAANADDAVLAAAGGARRPGLRKYDPAAPSLERLRDADPATGRRYLEKLRASDVDRAIAFLEEIVAGGRDAAPWAWERYGDWLGPVERLRELERRFPELRPEYAAWSGVDEGYTLKQHTLMVLWQFERFVAPKLPAGADAELFRAMLALHDIGKPAAMRAGSKARQHEFTGPMMVKFLTAQGYTAAQVALALALMDADPVGPLVRIRPAYKLHAAEPVIDLAAAADKGFRELEAMRAKTGLPLKTLLELNLAFFMSDASAYTRMAGGVASLDALFERNGDRLEYSAATKERLRPLIDRVNAAAR